MSVLDRSMIQLQFSWRGPSGNYVFLTHHPKYCLTVSSLIAIFFATDFIGKPDA